MVTAKMAALWVVALLLVSGVYVHSEELIQATVEKVSSTTVPAVETSPATLESEPEIPSNATHQAVLASSSVGAGEVLVSIDLTRGKLEDVQDTSMAPESSVDDSSTGVASSQDEEDSAASPLPTPAEGPTADSDEYTLAEDSSGHLVDGMDINIDGVGPSEGSGEGNSFATSSGDETDPDQGGVLTDINLDLGGSGDAFTSSIPDDQTEQNVEGDNVGTSGDSFGHLVNMPSDFKIDADPRDSGNSFSTNGIHSDESNQSTEDDDAVFSSSDLGSDPSNTDDDSEGGKLVPGMPNMFMTEPSDGSQGMSFSSLNSDDSFSSSDWTSDPSNTDDSLAEGHLVPELGTFTIDPTADPDAKSSSTLGSDDVSFSANDWTSDPSNTDDSLAEGHLVPELGTFTIDPTADPDAKSSSTLGSDDVSFSANDWTSDPSNTDDSLEEGHLVPELGTFTIDPSADPDAKSFSSLNNDDQYEGSSFATNGVYPDQSDERALTNEGDSAQEDFDESSFSTESKLNTNDKPDGIFARRSEYGQPPRSYGGVWRNARSTFYGGMDAAGTMSGACGYGNLYASGYGVNTAALSSALFKNGMACGACFEVQCSGKAKPCKPGSVVVTATNFCPPNPGQSASNGGWCNPPNEHFDLSYPAFVKIADPKSGAVPVQYRRVPCQKQGGIRFTINGNCNFILVTITNVGGSGVVTAAYLKGDKTEWSPLSRNWGANWNCRRNYCGQGISIKIVTSDNKVSITKLAKSDWCFGKTFIGKQV